MVSVAPVSVMLETVSEAVVVNSSAVASRFASVQVAVAVRRVGVRITHGKTAQRLVRRSRRDWTLTGRMRPARRLVVPRIRVVGDGERGGSCLDAGDGLAR